MITSNLNLGRYRLSLKLTQRRGGRHDFFLKLIDEVGHVRVGNRASRIVRLAISRLKLRRFIGANITALVVAMNIMTPSVSAFNSLESVEPEVVAIETPDAPITTVVKRRYPVEKPIISQGYSFFHPALDIDGVTGDPIYPIMNGRIEAVGREFFFGNAVHIKHADGFTSVYAHLSKTNVKSGEEVTTNTMIGEMGSTGHAFGDHLHLEVYKNGQNINPLTVLPPRQ